MRTTSPGLVLTGPVEITRRLIRVLDPGTPETIVDWDLAAQIGLDRSQSIGRAGYFGMDRAHDGYYVRASELEIFGRRITDFKIACCPFSTKLETDCLLGGTRWYHIGLDFLRNAVLTLYFKRGQLVLED